MNMLVKLMKDIEEISKIPFKLKKLVGDIYTSPNFSIENGYVQTTLKLSNEEFILQVAKEDERVLPLLSSAIMTNIKTFNIDENTILSALAKVKNPFRFQYFADKNLIVDASHNPNGVEALRENLDFYFPNKIRHSNLSNHV